MFLKALKYELLPVIFAPFLSIIIHFIFLFNGYDRGGNAMALFVYIPLMFAISFFILIINFIYFRIKKRNVSSNATIFIFLGIMIALFLEDFFIEYHQEENLQYYLKEDGNQLIFYPPIIASVVAFIYYNRKIFLV